jgi:hypothetical protein
VLTSWIGARSGGLRCRCEVLCIVCGAHYRICLRDNYLCYSSTNTYLLNGFQFELLPVELAKLRPAGKGRSMPNQFPELPVSGGI